MLGEPLNFSDIMDIDKKFFDNLKWCLQNDINEMGLTFVTETEYFGKVEEVELIPGGKNITVTNENKLEYFEKLVFYKLYVQVKSQIDAFLDGFYEIIPKDLVSIFNYKELELLISGLPYYDCKIQYSLQLFS
jgi:E3 ubiquitin-protein ligase HUWE1